MIIKKLFKTKCTNFSLKKLKIKKFDEFLVNKIIACLIIYSIYISIYIILYEATLIKHKKRLALRRMKKTLKISVSFKMNLLKKKKKKKIVKKKKMI